MLQKCWLDHSVASYVQKWNTGCSQEERPHWSSRFRFRVRQKWKARLFLNPPLATSQNRGMENWTGSSKTCSWIAISAPLGIRRLHVFPAYDDLVDTWRTRKNMDDLKGNTRDKDIMFVVVPKRVRSNIHFKKPESCVPASLCSSHRVYRNHSCKLAKCSKPFAQRSRETEKESPAPRCNNTSQVIHDFITSSSPAKCHRLHLLPISPMRSHMPLRDRAPI